MNKIKLAALVSAAVISSSAVSAEIYKTDTASLSINGRVKAEVLNSYGYLNQTKKSNPDDHPGFIGSARLGVSGERRVRLTPRRPYGACILPRHQADSRIRKLG